MKNIVHFVKLENIIHSLVLWPVFLVLLVSLQVLKAYLLVRTVYLGSLLIHLLIQSNVKIVPLVVSPNLCLQLIVLIVLLAHIHLHQVFHLVFHALLGGLLLPKDPLYVDWLVRSKQFNCLLFSMCCSSANFTESNIM